MMKWIKPTYTGIITLLMAFLPFITRGQCQGIDFTPDKTQVCAPKLVQFIVQNNPAGASYTWDYGFGETPGKDTGQYIYTAPDSYTVTLKITLSNGTVCTVTKTNIIEVFTPPVPFFSVSRPVLCSGVDTVTITDLSTGGTSRTWSIDGLPIADTSAKINPVFTTTGYKDIVLALNSAQCPTAYYQVNGAVRIYDPLTFDFEADTTTGCTPALITYKATNITPGHTINTYDWAFAGGLPATAALAQPTIQYNAGGSYSTTLKLTNTDGCTHQVSKTNYVVLGDTNGYTITTNKNSGCRGEEFLIDLVNPTQPGTFTWDFGTGVSQAGSTPVNQRVLFNDTGRQTVTLTREHNGCTVIKTFKNLIHITPPLASFIILNPFECDSTERVYVFNRAKLAPGTTHNYLWKLYDYYGNIETTSTDSIPVFYTSRNYSYSLELVVKSSNGCSDSAFQQYGINRRQGNAKFSVSNDVGCTGNPVNFFSTSPQFSSGEPNLYEWTLYDKNGVDILVLQNSGAFPSFLYTFNDTGTYGARLRVYNSKCGDTVYTPAVITIVKPATNITISDTLPCVKTPLLLNVSTTPSIAPNNYSYTWWVQNSSDTTVNYQATGPGASITPDKPGNYNIRLITKWGNNTCADTIQTFGKIKISAPALTVSYSNPNGCVPLAGTATTALKDNYNYKNPVNGGITYNWYTSPTAGVAITSPNAPSTQVNFNKQGAYTLSVIATNGSGCRDTFSFSLPINVGVQAGFSPNKPAICVGDTAIITDQTGLAPQSFQWYSVPPSPVFLPSANVAAPKIVFPDSGSFVIYQVVSKNGMCYDTAYQTLKSVKTIAGFSTVDTNKYCSPVPINFTNHSQNADSLVWYMGDGKFVRSYSIPTLRYVYFNNSGPQGFDVKLIAMNKLGCRDSLTRPSYITILGPVPNFTVDTVVGCDPLTVTFTDKSFDYDQYYFDYGDGSNFDSTGNPGTHTYTNKDALSEGKTYKPKVFLIDKQGCLATFEHPEIRSNNRPQITFTAEPDSGCTPLTVNFTDSTLYARKLSWDFDGDGIEDDNTHHPTFNYTNAGIFSPRLKATSQYGCVEEDTLMNYIHAFGHPTAAFSVAKNDNDIENIFYTLTNQSANHSSVMWYADTTFIGTAPVLQYAFADTGHHTVSLVAISDVGCRDSLDSVIYIIPEYFFHVPNAFTPNNKEANETFGLYAPLWAKRFKMRIYNRYGELVFETANMAHQWDGTFNNQPCQQDVYLYTIEYLDLYSKWHVFKGSLHLLR